MPEAARIGDEIAHSQAQLGFWLGSIAAAVVEGVAAYALGTALAGLACVFPFGTLAAIGIGLVVGILVIGPVGDFIQSAGEAIGSTFTVVKGVLTGIGSTDVTINFRPAVRAMPGIDFAMCSEHGPKPSYVIEGATNVWINKLRAARKGDAIDCDGKISSGSDNVKFGSPPVAVGNKRSKEISDDERKAAGYLRAAAGIIGGSLVGANGLPCFLANVAVGVGVAVGASAVLGDIIPHMDYGTNAGKSAGTSFGNWLQGKPVHIPTGAKILPSETDIFLPGAFPLRWARFYNSRDARVGVLGQGWGTPLSYEIVFQDEKLIFIGEQGRENKFDDLAPNESRYNPAEQLKVTRSAGGHYYLSYPGDNLIYAFGARTSLRNGERLHLQRVMDMHDNGIDFHYDERGFVHEMISSAGHVLTLTYSNGDQNNVRLREVRSQSVDVEGNHNSASQALVTYEYDKHGDLSRVRDRTGSLVREFAYKNHMMVSHSFASGLQSYYIWDAYVPEGRVIKQSSNDGQVLTFRYLDEPHSPADLIESDLPAFSQRHIYVVDQLGRTQQFTCNRHYLVTKFVGPMGATTHTEFDANKRITRFVDAEGGVTQFGYDRIGQLAAVYNALGQSATIKWHPKFSRVSSVTRYDGSIWEYAYDDRGSLIEIKGPNGFLERVMVDDRGLAVMRIDAKGGTVRLAYNEQAQLTHYTDCSDKTTSYRYGVSGAEQHRLIEIKNALGSSQLFSHNDAGHLASVKLADGAEHRYEYDTNGLLIRHTNAQGRGSHYVRNIRGDVVAQQNAAGGHISLQHDAGFRMTALVNENNQQYRFVYDEADRLVEEQRVDGTRVKIEYNNNAQPIAIINFAGVGDGVFTQVELEADGESLGTAASYATSIRTDLVRDALGRLTEKRTPSHHFHYSYDAAGRLAEALKLRVQSHTGASGTLPTLTLLHTTRFTYDELGDLIEETATDSVSGTTHSLKHHHDELGNRLKTTLPDMEQGGVNQRALNYLFYGSGHLHQINLSHGGEGANETDANYQLIADIERDDTHQEVLRTQGGLTTRYSYDPVGRRNGAWTRAGAVTSRPFSAAFGEDSGFAQALAFPSAHDGLLKQYSYDLSGELRQRIHTQQGKISYGYDAQGRVENAHRSARNGQASSEQFQYDPAGNLLDHRAEPNATIDSDSSTKFANHATQGERRGFVYDNLVRVFEDKRFFYDGFSRLIEKRIAKHTVHRYEWDDEHHLTAVHTTRLGYAAERARKSKAENKFVNTHESPSVIQTIRFEYDAIGRRIAKHDTFGTTYFVWEGMRLIEERRGHSIVTYVYEPGSYAPLARIDIKGNPTKVGGLGATHDRKLQSELVAESESITETDRPSQEVVDTDRAANEDWDALREPTYGGNSRGRTDEKKLANIYYFHTDQVGLPEELSDEHGQIRWRAAYKTWGGAIAERWEAVNLAGEALAERANDPLLDNKPLDVEQNLRFQGQYLDRESGLHYNTFRFYDPDIGRFISPDPIGLNGGLNLHSYAPNPNTWIDPWGWACASANDTVTRGANGEVQTVKGTISPADIGSGTNTNASSRAAARALGNATDDAGHMRGNNLGGSGGKANTFPQDPHVNRGDFQVFEGRIADHVQTTQKPVSFEQTYNYGNGGTRPSSIDYTITDPTTGAVILQQTFPN